MAFRALGEELFLSNLAEALDLGAEKDRLTRQIADKERSLSAIEKRLSNPGYIERAPAKLVEESKQQLDSLRAEIAALTKRLGELA